MLCPLPSKAQPTSSGPWELISSIWQEKKKKSSLLEPLSCLKGLGCNSQLLEKKEKSAGHFYPHTQKQVIKTKGLEYDTRPHNR